MATGDVNGDGRADIAGGAPGEAIGTVTGAGAATVLYGGPGGATGSGAQQISEDVGDVTGHAEENDLFGSQVSLADLNGDGKADLSVGARGENDGGGALYMLTGGASGVSTTGRQDVLLQHARRPGTRRRARRGDPALTRRRAARRLRPSRAAHVPAPPPARWRRPSSRDDAGPCGYEARSGADSRERRRWSLGAMP
ncbi:hypothetical protein F8568_045250 [Actinomadura sp. LD22]|uniref:VCBS repeat-containing protein n=1 Tax=Actinomadura physcomitrii TaxID=2650748 RepID=A0A6I4MRL0_9ACTN|nr:hypothetical protein [Actinomadura physcomitrii]